MADINLALLHCDTKSLLKIPTSVIKTFKIDDEGNIFIFMSRPKQLLSQFEKEFPADLNYSRKGKNYFINVHGKARIIDDPEELTYYGLTLNEIGMALTEQMLIKVKIYKADYHEKDVNNDFFRKIRILVSNVLHLVNGGEGTYDFSNFHGIAAPQDFRVSH